MSNKAIAILAAFLSGAFVAVMALLNALLGKSVGVLESTAIVHIVGAIFSLAIISYQINKKFFLKIKSSPRYLLFGGTLGVVIVVIANIAIPVLGMVATISISIIANLLFCAIADQFGLFGLQRFPITLRRFTGLILSLFGLLLVFWR